MSVVQQFMIPIKFKPEVITATAGQTIFNLSTITITSSDPDRVLVLINGRKQLQNAFTVASPTQIVMSEGLEVGDEFEVIIISRT